MRIKDLAINAKEKMFSGSVIQPNELSPLWFDDFVGQHAAIDQLKLMTEAAKERKEPLDHLLMTGPGGLGKTTLMMMIANEMRAPLFASTANVLSADSLGKILSTMRPGTIVAIDEFHGLSKGAGLVLYSAMQDHVIDVSTPAGPQHRKVPPFTLIAATTEPGMLTESMKDRFGHIVELGFYEPGDMQTIALRSADALNVKLDTDAALDLAERSRGVPRVLNQYLRRIRDYVQVKCPTGQCDEITEQDTEQAFEFFGVDTLGLTQVDRDYLIKLVKSFRGGPVGGENLATVLGVDYKTVQNDIEPYLMRLGLVSRANRGRIANDDARAYVAEMLGEDSDGIG